MLLIGHIDTDRAGGRTDGDGPAAVSGGAPSVRRERRTGRQPGGTNFDECEEDVSLSPSVRSPLLLPSLSPSPPPSLRSSCSLMTRSVGRDSRQFGSVSGGA